LSATHGFVLLAMSGFIDFQGLQDVMAPMTINLMVGLGDTRRRAERSLAAAIKARASQRQNKSRLGQRRKSEKSENRLRKDSGLRH
jgi:hypothetical protein